MKRSQIWTLYKASEYLKLTTLTKTLKHWPGLKCKTSGRQEGLHRLVVFPRRPERTKQTSTFLYVFLSDISLSQYLASVCVWAVSRTNSRSAPPYYGSPNWSCIHTFYFPSLFRCYVNFLCFLKISYFLVYLVLSICEYGPLSRVMEIS